MDPRGTLTVGLAPLTVGRPDPSTMVAAAAAGGFAAVGMSLWVPGRPCRRVCGDARLLRTTRQRVDDAGVDVVDTGVVVLDRALDTDAVKRVLETACRLGSDRVIAMNQDDDAARAATALRAVSDIAASFGMVVGVEFMPYTSTRTLQDACLLIAQVGADNVGVVLDVLHLFRSGGRVEDLQTLGPVPLHLVQLCDARLTAPAAQDLRAEALRGRLAPGRGDLPLRELLAAVPAGVPVTLEAPTQADVGRSATERAVRAGDALRSFLGG
jgi:sugar phosphate isomerase/epimerase